MPVPQGGGLGVLWTRVQTTNEAGSSRWCLLLTGRGACRQAGRQAGVWAGGALLRLSPQALQLPALCAP